MSHEVDYYYGFYHEMTHKARKSHVCAACGGSIEPGTVYTRISFEDEGHISSLKRCWRCQTIHVHLRSRLVFDGEWPDEWLNCGETYQERFGEDPPPEIAELAFASPSCRAPSP